MRRALKRDHSLSVDELEAQLRRATVKARRRLYRVSLVAGVLAVWATISTVAAWHLHQDLSEVRPEVTASDRPERAMDALEAVLFRLAREFRDLTDAPRRRLVEVLADAATDFTTLTEDAAGIRPARLRRNADLLIELSTTYLALGDAERAREAAVQARSQVERLDEQKPKDRNRLAATHLAEGDAFVARDNIDGAIAAYGVAAGIRGALSAAAPNDPDLLRGLSVAFEREGQALDLRGESERAGERLRQALAIRGQLAATGGSGDSGMLEPLAIAHSNLGDHSSRAGRPDEAIEHYRTAYEIYLQLAELEPESTTWRDSQALHLGRIGRAQAEAGDYADGIETLDQAAEAYRDLMETDSGGHRWQSRLADVLEWTGASKLERSDLPGARAAYTAALDIRRHQAERDPLESDHARAFATALTALAKVDRVENLDDIAHLRVAEALELRRQVFAAEPADARVAGELAQALAVAAEFGIAPQAHLEEALEVLKRFAETEQLPGEHEPLAEDIRQRLASFTQ